MGLSLTKWAWLRMSMVVGVLVVFGAGIAWYWHAGGPPASALRTTVVKRDDLLATVTATGTIEPEELVDVGAQVVGMITEFGRDPSDCTKPIDYLSMVEVGTVLARIDDSIYRARLDRAAAHVEQAKAQIAQSEADLRRAQANAQHAEAVTVRAANEWERARKLLTTTAISQEEYEAKVATHAVARADQAVSEAAVDQARANKLAAESALQLAEADRREAQQYLDYTVIRSPVKGVIVDRRVNVGQTVVSSLNAPSLFLIAKDLKRLEVWASVNEADVGRLRRGQAVRFTVDAFPDDVFQGRVGQVRLNATMTQNVVTYTVEVETDNTDGRLLPYLTANLHFEVGRRQHALLVPNAALRWYPRPDQIVADVARQLSLSQGSQVTTDSGISPPAETKVTHDRGLVWVEDGGSLQPIEVRLGLSDGLQTEVVGGELREGQLVVVGEELPAEEQTASPFAPRFFGSGHR